MGEGVLGGPWGGVGLLLLRKGCGRGGAAGLRRREEPEFALGSRASVCRLESGLYSLRRSGGRY